MSFLSSSWAGSSCWSLSGDHYNFLPVPQQCTTTPSLTLTDPAEHTQYIWKPFSVWKSVAVSQHFSNICFPKAYTNQIHSLPQTPSLLSGIISPHPRQARVEHGARSLSPLFLLLSRISSLLPSLSSPSSSSFFFFFFLSLSV